MNLVLNEALSEIENYYRKCHIQNYHPIEMFDIVYVAIIDYYLREIK